MTLEEALRMLPEQQRDAFTFQVEWWQFYGVDNEMAPEGWAVEQAFARMRPERVTFTLERSIERASGGWFHSGHWCEGLTSNEKWLNCIRCYGD